MGFKNPLEETIMAAYDPGSRVTSVTDRMGLTEAYTYDPHGNTLSVKAANGLVTRFSYDILDNLVRVTMPSELTTSYTYDVMGNVTSMTDTMKRTTAYTYDLEGNMTSIHDPSGRTERMGYDIGGRLTSCISNGGNRVSYDYDVLNSLVEKAYEDGEGNAVNEGVVYGYDVLGRRVSMMDRSGDSSYEYDGLGRITKVTAGSGEATTYVYDAINRVTEIHRPNGVNTYNTYNARDQIVSMVNRCDECEWIVSRYDYTYDDRGFIVAEDAAESLYAYAWDDKHDGKHESWHDDLFPHGNKHINKHDKDGIYNFQIIETKRAFTYDDDGRLLTAAENEDRQGRYDYVFKYDADGNRILEEEVKPDGNRKVEKSYEYSVENRLKAVRDAHDLLVAMAYDGDGNRIFQLNYNLHTDDDWKGNSGNGNGNNKDNTGSGNNGNGNGNKKGAAAAIAEFFTGEEPEAGKLNAGVSQALAERLFSEEILGGLAEGLGIPEETVTAQEETGTDSSDTANADYGQTMTATPGNAAPGAVSPGNAAASYAGKNDNGNNGNGGNGNHYGWGNGNNGNGNGNSGNGNGNSSTGGTNDNNGNAGGNTNNTGGSQNQSGILFPVAGEVSELEQELIDMIKTTGKQKNYELVEYVNDVNRDHVEVLMELNINGIMDTAYSYGNERLTNERFTGWTGYYTYDPRGSVTGVTGIDGYIWQSYRYNAFGDITDPLTLNRYNYVKSSPLNYIDPSGKSNIPYVGDLYDYFSGKMLSDFWNGLWSYPGKVAEDINENVGKKTSEIKKAMDAAVEKASPYLKRCDDFITGITVTVKLGDEAMDSLLGMKAEGNTYLEETGDVIYWDWYDAGEQIGKILANCKNAGTLFVIVMHSMNGTGPQTVMVVADEYGNIMVMDGDAIAIENTGIVMFGGGKNNKDDKGDSETGNWNKGSFDSPEDSLDYHYGRHGDEVGATSRDQYLRKAEEFAKTAKKGSTKSRVDGAVEGTIRYKKNGKYIDIAPDGSIVSFGKQ